MKKWNWDYLDLRRAIKGAYRMDKVGNNKFEAYCKEKTKSKKIIFVFYQENDTILVITGAEGTEI